MKSILSVLAIISCGVLFFSSCQKEMSEEHGLELKDAEGSLQDSLNNCLPSTVFGTYYNGITPGSDTCFVEIQVNVTSAGTYVISTDLQNGFEFLDSGFFNNTGINTIRLKPIGTPIIPVATSFNVTFDSSVCSFVVNVKDSTGTGLGGGDTTGGDGGAGDTTQASLGMWKLFDSTNAKEYSGPAAVVDTLITGIPVLVVQGAVSTLDTVLLIQLVVPDTALDTFVPQVFQTGLQNSFKYSYLSGSTLIDFYVADVTTSQKMNINLTSYNSVNRILSGRFSGTVLVAGTANTVSITNGSFTVGVP